MSMSMVQKNFLTTQAVDVLKKGGVTVYPTETAYGLGADATNHRAVERIFKIKGRAHAKSVLLLMKDVAMVKRYALVSAEELSLMKKFWPCALTIVLRVKPEMRSKLAQGVVAKDGSIAVRVSSNTHAHALVKGLGKPLVSTSANRAGGANTYSVAGVKKQLGASLRATSFPYYIYDAGILPRRKVSTIVRLYKGRVEVLRQGEIIL
ncbi:MAG TPA: threonylcarbamoyl-AMP synthase [Candidatus Magasanikbacteria bacterium]|nr:threonylcarbamoyl-AMP synthase [Candidatus Magasanikbacteria bacterium]